MFNLMYKSKKSKLNKEPHCTYFTVTDNVQGWQGYGQRGSDVAVGVEIVTILLKGSLEALIISFKTVYMLSNFISRNYSRGK